MSHPANEQDPLKPNEGKNERTSGKLGWLWKPRFVPLFVVASLLLLSPVAVSLVVNLSPIYRQTTSSDSTEAALFYILLRPRLMHVGESNALAVYLDTPENPGLLMNLDGGQYEPRKIKTLTCELVGK